MTSAKRGREFVDPIVSFRLPRATAGSRRARASRRARPRSATRGVARAQRGERLGVVLLRLLRERLAAERDVELLLAGGERARVGGASRAGSTPAISSRRSGSSVGSSARPRLEGALGARVEHALDPRDDARRARADAARPASDRSSTGRAARRAPKSANAGRAAEEVRPRRRDARSRMRELALERASIVSLRRRRRADEREARHHAARGSHRASAAELGSPARRASSRARCARRPTPGRPRRTSGSGTSACCPTRRRTPRCSAETKAAAGSGGWIDGSGCSASMCSMIGVESCRLAPSGVDHERDQRQLRVALGTPPRSPAAHDPLVRDALVAEVGADLHRVRRQLDPEDAVGGGFGHGSPPRAKVSAPVVACSEVSGASVPAIELVEVTKRYGDRGRRRRPVAAGRARRAPGPARRLGLRQDHDAQDGEPPDRADGGRGRDRRRATCATLAPHELRRRIGYGFQRSGSSRT